MVKSFYVRDEKRLGDTIRNVNRSIADVQRPTGTEKNRSLLKVQTALEALSAQQNTIATAVAELSARSSHQVAPPNLTLVYGTGFNEKGPVSESFTMPGPLVRRTAILVGSGIFEWAGTSSTSALPIYLRMEVRQGSKLVWSGVGNVSNNPFIPADFNGSSFSVVASLQVPAGDEVSFEIRLSGYRSADGGTTADAGRVAGMSFTITYGDKY